MPRFKQVPERRKKKRKRGESLSKIHLVFHRKAVICEDPTVQTQIQFRKRNLRSSIDVSIDYFEVKY
jgi:hypothetical protein